MQLPMQIRHLLALSALAVLGLYGSASANPSEAPGVGQQTQATNSNGNQVLHILVGRSVVVHTDQRLTRVLVGNAAVVSTSTTSPNEVVISATAAGSSSVVLWQEDNQSRILDVFADLDVSLLRDAIERGFPDEPIQAEAEEGRVLLTGTASTAGVADQVVKMAAPFSKA